jgi:putative ABC transport system permease protein
MFTLVLVGMAGGFTIIAVANTLLMDAVSRRPELVSLGRLGATRRQLLRLVLLETSFVVTVGTLLGFATSLPGLLAIREGLSAQIGHPVALVLPWPTISAVTCACLAGALLASLAPMATDRLRRRNGQPAQ